MSTAVGKLGSAARGLILASRASVAALPTSSNQKRTVVNKSLLRLPEDYPEPWPYKEKGYRNEHFYLGGERTMPHFTENSRLIVVEGNIGVGKSRMAKELADQLGFHFIPEFRMDDILVDRYGNDLRNFYHMFPKRYRMPDADMFYKNPADDMSAVMQDRMFQCRFEQYLNSVAHILNTGQGVVVERSPYSDFVFTNAMRAKNWIGPEYFKHYFYVRKRALPQLHFWPHLVVYLDAPPAKCLENIRKRGNVNEIATVDETYLKVIQESYKDSLKEYRRHSKILAYDWTNPGDTDTIVEDIERLDLDFFEWHSGEVLEEWNVIKDEINWAKWRKHVTQKDDARYHAFSGIRTHEVGELYTNPNDTGHFLHVMKKFVLKSPNGYGYIQKNGDEMAGVNAWHYNEQLPEQWYEYYWREKYYDDTGSIDTNLDYHSDSYNPDYLAHHH